MQMMAEEPSEEEMMMSGALRGADGEEVTVDAYFSRCHPIGSDNWEEQDARAVSKQAVIEAVEDFRVDKTGWNFLLNRNNKTETEVFKAQSAAYARGFSERSLSRKRSEKRKLKAAAARPGQKYIPVAQQEY